MPLLSTPLPFGRELFLAALMLAAVAPPVKGLGPRVLKAEVVSMDGHKGFVYANTPVHANDVFQITVTGKVKIGPILGKVDADGISEDDSKALLTPKGLLNGIKRIGAGTGETGQAKDYKVLLSAPLGALIVRTQELGTKPEPIKGPSNAEDKTVQPLLKEKDWKVVGTSYTYFAKHDGLLRFVINDSTLWNNSGAFVITIVKR